MRAQQVEPDNNRENTVFGFETPCYLIDEGRLGNNVENLKNGFSNVWNHDVVYGYSVKTNSLPWILTYMKSKGFLAEVVSEQEFKLARRMGYDADRIILNGPVKSADVLIKALNGGAFVNLDNLQEIYILKENVHKRVRDWKVGLRYNFYLEEHCPGETIVGKNYSRFGINVENGDFAKAIEIINGMDGVWLTGLHGHNSTKTKSLNIFRMIASMGKELVDRYDLNLDYFDIGGGFFGDKPGTPDYFQYAESIKEGFQYDKEIKLIVEPGASLVSSPLSYLCEVVNTKEVGDNRFVTLDGSSMHINPMLHDIHFSLKTYDKDKDVTESTENRQILCGFTCIEMDRMGTVDNNRLLKCGDRIEFYNCGSYSMTLSPLFIGYFPAVYVEYSHGNRIVRRAWDENDFLANCEVDL